MVEFADHAVGTVSNEHSLSDLEGAHLADRLFACATLIPLVRSLIEPPPLLSPLGSHPGVPRYGQPALSDALAATGARRRSKTHSYQAHGYFKSTTK